MATPTEIMDALQELREARAKGLRIRRGVMAVTLGAFVLFFGNLYIKIQTYDTDALVTHLQTRATRLVWPVYAKELQGVADDAVPAISDALTAEAEQLLPRISERLQAQADIFQLNMGKYMGDALDREFGKATKDKDKELRARFPAFAKDPAAYEALMDRLRTSSQSWAHHQLDTTFKQHIRILQSINRKVRMLQQEAKQLRKTEGDTTTEEVLTLLAEIVHVRTSGEPGAK
jgi:hypothetical protein